MADVVKPDLAKLVEMLHPMREPPLPDSIVPALVLLVGGGVAAIVLVGLAWRVFRRSNGLRAAAAATLAASRGLQPADRLAAQAALLRRLVRAVGGGEAARQHGAAWLESLDRCFETDFFSKGGGRAYGEALYAPTPPPDVDALDRALSGLIRRVRPVAAGRREAA